ncbi:MAG: preprotein translocase subunit SecG [Clostridia bacterium]|nr:preprotein translocase subunit SecG [Clostridia bacterium]
MFNLLADALLPNWVINSFPVIKFILLCLIVLAAVALIVIVLLQDSEGDATSNAITGIKDTYYSQNKGMNREGRLKKATIVLSIFIAVAVVLFFVLTEIYPNSLWS